MDAVDRVAAFHGDPSVQTLLLQAGTALKSVAAQLKWVRHKTFLHRSMPLVGPLVEFTICM
jgi:hypothetical protein